MSLHEDIQSLQVVDSHEHLMPLPVRERAACDFSYLFSNYLQPEFGSVGMSSEQRHRFLSDDTAEEEKIALFQKFWPGIRNTSVARVKVEAARQFYGIDQFDESSLRELSCRIRDSRNRDVYQEWFEKSGVVSVVINYLKTHKAMGWTEEFSDRYSYAVSFDDFVWLGSRTEISDLENELSLTIADLDDLRKALAEAFRQRIHQNAVAVKMVTAYYRTLYVSDQDPAAAADVFRRIQKIETRPFDPQLRGLHLEWASPLQDFMLHEIARLASDRNLPVQIHVGYQAGNGNLIANTDPAKLCSFLLQHERTKFELLHVGLPYHLTSLALSKMFENVYVNFSWIFALSPTIAKDSMRAAIEMVPAEKIIGFGGDYRLIEAICIHLKWARAIVTECLIERIDQGYFGYVEALDFAKKIFYSNPRKLYRMHKI